VHRNNHSTFDVVSAWDPICVMNVLFSQVYNEKEKKNVGKRIKNKRKYEGFFFVCVNRSARLSRLVSFSCQVLAFCWLGRRERRGEYCIVVVVVVVLSSGAPDDE
jgi:hypothetical protein